LGDRKEICPIKNLYQLPPQVLIRNKWKKGTEGNQLTQVHLENGKYVLFMAALFNRAGHIYFHPVVSSSSSSFLFLFLA